MSPALDPAVEIQRDYYTATAERYEKMHAHESSGNVLSMRFVHSMLHMLNACAVLDLGTAKGAWDA
jgi:hypothetical protein